MEENLNRLRGLVDFVIRECESNPDVYRPIRSSICGIDVLVNRLLDRGGEQAS